MSLANIILQRPAGYLLTDTGWFNRDGTIAQLSSKVLEIAPLRIAITCRGRHEMLAGIWREVLQFLGHLPEATGADLIANFAELYQVACWAQKIPSRGAEHACGMQVLYYCPDEQRTKGYVIANETSEMPGLAPFELQPVTSLLQGGIDPRAPFAVPIDVGDPREFDVRVDGLRLGQAQRLEPWSLPGFPKAHYVAGSLLLTTVGQFGVRTETLHTWQDEVGQRVMVEVA